MQQYKLLSSARVVFKIAGWVSLVISILLGVGTFLASSQEGLTIPFIQRIISGAVFVGIGIFYLYAFFVASQICVILLEIKNNTREGVIKGDI